MALRASAHSILVSPTGNNAETQRGRLVVIENSSQEDITYRGVVLDVGEHVIAKVDVGHLLHYTHCHEIEGKHIVPEQYVVAYDDGEPGA